MAELDPKATQELIGLIPVAAGAAIALAGGTIKHFVDRKAKRNQLRREKLERLLMLAFELKPWTDKVDDRYTHGSVGSSRVDLQACKLEYSIVSPK